ncbi:ARF GAP-like zinc finger-containing protein [Histomonas meleagridis]|uniref:ARF GAP-like zinc finger-containing protein n=1 Tax=Histomonas meleagridis TaxID=135588 RepID=UPI003559C488|nr:ARF GAP-like zinc finger-containing protein [Histomonas meleagridis]KAH0806141.1 ARF GAP-like zinc finger-containing protein [Histomonas meleagridis]
MDSSNEPDLFQYFDPSPLLEQSMLARLKEQSSYIHVIDKLHHSFTKISSNLADAKKEFEKIHEVTNECKLLGGFEDLLTSICTLFDTFKISVDECCKQLHTIKSVFLPLISKHKSEFNKSNNEFQKVIEEYGALGAKTKPEIISQTETNLKNVMCNRSSILYETMKTLITSEKSTTPSINTSILEVILAFLGSTRIFFTKNNNQQKAAQDYIKRQDLISTFIAKNDVSSNTKNEAYRNAIDCWEIREKKVKNIATPNVSHVVWYRSKKRVGGWVRRYATFDEGVFVLYDPINGRKDTSFSLLLVTAIAINKKKRRFCFKVQSPEYTIILQALTAYDLDEWLSIFANHNTKMIRGNEPETTDDSTNQMICADCGATDATWCALNWGNRLCLKCCSTHRQMSTKVSKIRSVILDKLHPFYHNLLNVLTNECSNSLLLSKDCDVEVGPRMDDDIRTMYVLKKYQNKQWATVTPPPDPFESIERLDFRALVHSMNFGRATDVFEGIKPIHAAAAIGNPIIVAIAVSCTVEVDEPDTNKWTALCYAIFYQNIETVKFLLDCGAKTKETEVDLLLMAVATGNQQLVELFLENTTKSDSEKVQKFVPTSTRFAPYGLREQKELIVTNEIRTITRLLRAKD